MKKIKINNEFIRKFFSYFLFLCFGLTMLYISFSDGLLFFILFVLLSAFIIWKKKINNFVLILFMISLIIRILAVIFVKTPIMSDFAVMYNTATSILNNDMSYTINSSYMNTWGYQMGHTMYLYFLRLICDSVLFLKIINCLITSGVVVLVYLVAKELASEKSARFIGIMYCFFPFPLLMNTVLTNQHLPALFILLAFYLIISKKCSNMNSTLKYILVGLLIALANVLRPEGIVYITSFILFFILLLRKNNWLIVLKKFLLLFFTYLLVFNGISFALKETGYSKIGLENKNPLWKFVVGLNPNTYGVYSNDDAKLYGKAGREDEMIELIKDRTIGNIFNLPNLFLKKSEILWTHSDLSWSLYYLDNKQIHVLGHSFNGSHVKVYLTKINQYFIYLILILMLIGIIPTKKEKISDEKLLLIIVLLVFFGVYLLIEIMPRYAYSMQVFEYILAAIGVDRIIALKNKKKLTK